MVKRIDFKALSIGVLIFAFCSIAAGFLLAAALAELSIQTGYELMTDKSELALEFLLAWFSVFWAGYYAQKTARKPGPDHSLLLGAILFAYHLIGTISAGFDPEGDPFVLNIAYDGSIVLFSLLGGKFARRERNKKEAVTVDIQK
ncbi:hypothetical protein [Paenibacillus arenilitoris]|uniref:Uncharacterized protein n=1 Tax=Paenibacillus arenilitoris TaxID=2772299 RepID=A0A927CKK8_9BACL|nr:hypothetical protein [Paenibacillus arenilitoris]MBD2868298.1 hypothetical protein [Paenibacillus arenilitoris]